MTAIEKHNKTLSPEQKSLLIHSILRYFDRNGFSKTLKRLLSEAQVEDDNWKATFLDLEDMFCKYLETSSHTDTNFNAYKKQGKMDGTIKKDREYKTDGIFREHGDSNCTASEETVSKKKKKKRNERDDNAVENHSLSADLCTKSAPNLKIPANNGVIESNVKSKEKKKTKKISDSLGQTEQDSEALKELTDDTVCELQGNESTKSQKDDQNKKSKLPSEPLDGNLEHKELDSEAFKEPTNGTMCVLQMDESSKKHKDEKKMKSKLTSEIFNDHVGCEQLDSLAGVNEEKKDSKRRKRLASEENENQSVENVDVKEPKRRKTKGLEEAKSIEQLTKVNALQACDGNTGRESKGENGLDVLGGPQKTSIRQLDEPANGNIEKNGADKSTMQKSTRKKLNVSAEPKTVDVFQRVKVDEVVFSDERLQDNSYWSKDGAEVGYGAKAQEILGQVRGRDFRHEKTKKKRGSYRGGQIDLQSHSVKFNYSDDD